MPYCQIYEGNLNFSRLVFQGHFLRTFSPSKCTQKTSTAQSSITQYLRTWMKLE